MVGLIGFRGLTRITIAIKESGSLLTIHQYYQMNWIERMYELKGKDLYSQNSEGLYLEYIFHSWGIDLSKRSAVDIGAGDGFILSNTRHLYNLGLPVSHYDKINGLEITAENVIDKCFRRGAYSPLLVSIDIDGNDYWVIESFLSKATPDVIIAEFNCAFTDSRTIKYNPDHVWDGTDYFGFSFAAGVKLAERHGYKVIFQIADMNMIMVREDLIKVPVPPVPFTGNNFFEKSRNRDWVMI